MSQHTTYEKIENYLMLRMAPEERQAFERELASDTALQEALSKQQVEHHAMEVLVAKDLRGRLAKWEKNNAGRSRLAFYGMLFFLALVIGLTLVGLLNQKIADEPVPFLPNTQAPAPENAHSPAVPNLKQEKTEVPPRAQKQIPAEPDQSDYLAIAQSAYEAPDLQTLRNGGTPPESAYALALNLFSQKKYAQTLQELERTTTAQAIQADYLRGHIYFAQGRYALASEAFDKVHQQKSLRYADAALWYQALSEMAQGGAHIDNGLQILQTIRSDAQHPYYEPAVKLAGFGSE